MKTRYSFPLHDLHEIRPRLVLSFFTPCFPWDYTGFSGRNFLKTFGCTRSSLLPKTSLFVAGGATVWFQCTGFSILCSWCRSQPQGHSGSVAVAHWLICLWAFVIFPIYVSNTCLKHWIKRQNTLEGILNESLLHEPWHHGQFMRRLIKDCPCFKQSPEIPTDWGSPPIGFLQDLEAVVPFGFVLASVSESHTRAQLPEGRDVTWLTCKYMSVDIVLFRP